MSTHIVRRRIIEGEPIKQLWRLIVQFLTLILWEGCLCLLCKKEVKDRDVDTMHTTLPLKWLDQEMTVTIHHEGLPKVNPKSLYPLFLCRMGNLDLKYLYYKKRKIKNNSVSE